MIIILLRPYVGFILKANKKIHYKLSVQKKKKKEKNTGYMKLYKKKKEKKNKI